MGLIGRHTATPDGGVDDQLTELAATLRDCRGDVASELVVWTRIDALLDERLASCRSAAPTATG